MKITVITPSLNQGEFIERTIASVLAQRGDFELEYLVIDGGSTDSTLSVLRGQGGRVRWLSEPDRGQSSAINKGFRLATGEVLAWLNSDDTYAPGALQAATEALRSPGARWCFGECAVIDALDRPMRGFVSRYKAWVGRRFSVRRLVGRNFIPQPATFFRRDLLLEAGELDEHLHYAMDYDLWLRFARIASPAFLQDRLASFRWHGGAKTGGSYARAGWECLQVARRSARRGERLALAEHAAHLAVELAAYAALDVVARRRPAAKGTTG